MGQEPPEAEAWFPPKRYGYGAGLPFAWQGWALTIVYALVVIGLGVWAGHGGETWIAVAGIAMATAVFVPLVRRHTRGKWRWRHSERD